MHTDTLAEPGKIQFEIARQEMPPERYDVKLLDGEVPAVPTGSEGWSEGQLGLMLLLDAAQTARRGAFNKSYFRKVEKAKITNCNGYAYVTLTMGPQIPIWGMPKNRTGESNALVDH